MSDKIKYVLGEPISWANDLRVSEASVVFEYQSRKYTAKIGPEGIFVEGVGSWDGEKIKTDFDDASHVCGLRGFGYDSNDKCHACHQPEAKGLIAKLVKVFSAEK